MLRNQCSERARQATLGSIFGFALVCAAVPWVLYAHRLAALDSISNVLMLLGFLSPIGHVSQ